MPKRSSRSSHPYVFRRSNRRRSAVKKSKSRVYRPMSSAKSYRKSRFKQAVMNVVNRSAETKCCMLTLLSNGQLTHNTVHNIYNNAFYTKVGVAGEMVTSTPQGTRIGKKAFIKGISVALHIENQQYRPEVKYQLMLIRNKISKDATISAKDDIYEGLNSTIFLDWVDSDKVDIMFTKNITVKQSNVGTTLTAGPAGVFDHGEVEGILPDLYEGINTVSTNPRYMGKFYVPINSTVVYKDYNGTTGTDETIPASYRYQWVIHGYDNRTTATGSTTWPIGHVNMTTKIFFTDV